MIEIPTMEEINEARRYYEALRKGGLEEAVREWSELKGIERFQWVTRVKVSLRDYPETTRQLLALVEEENQEQPGRPAKR